MSSPVTGSDFVVGSQNQSLCERLTSLLGLTSKVKLWFDWAFDSSGEATTEFKAMFLPPPGTIVAYYLNAPEATVKARIEMIGRQTGDTKGPFWLLCDGASNLTPDLRGRTIVGGGQGTGLTNRPVDGSNFGSESVTIGKTNIPTKQHYHGYGDGVVSSDVNEDDAYLLRRNWSGSTGFPTMLHNSLSGGGGPTRTSGALGTTNAIDVDSSESETVIPIATIPPSMALWYMMRTSRVA